MHPAPSIILFTTLSGLGFGLLFWLGLGFPPVQGWVAFAFMALAYALAVGGLLASTLHLGNPRRAWRAFSQWRSSWLSREAVLSVGALVLMAGYGAGAVFFGERLVSFGWPGAALSLATVFATSMIYAQLKTVPRWNHWTTPALFVALALGGGALLSGQVRLAPWLLLAVGALQLAVWTLGDRRFAARGTSLASATGLGKIGRVRQFAPPHTGTNYLLKEMAYQIARKHALRLRVIAILLMSLIPAGLIGVGPGHIAGAVAVLAHLAGTLVARWLFFAEAEHVMALYYGVHDERTPPR